MASSLCFYQLSCRECPHRPKCLCTIFSSELKAFVEHFEVQSYSDVEAGIQAHRSGHPGRSRHRPRWQMDHGFASGGPSSSAIPSLVVSQVPQEGAGLRVLPRCPAWARGGAGRWVSGAVDLVKGGRRDASVRLGSKAHSGLGKHLTSGLHS